jgi:hypothetical protein
VGTEDTAGAGHRRTYPTPRARATKTLPRRVTLGAHAAQGEGIFVFTKRYFCSEASHFGRKRSANTGFFFPFFFFVLVEESVYLRRRMQNLFCSSALITTFRPCKRICPLNLWPTGGCRTCSSAALSSTMDPRQGFGRSVCGNDGRGTYNADVAC